MEQYTPFYRDDRYNAQHLAMLEDIRRDVRRITLRELRRDLLKLLLWWLVAPTVFYLLTHDNKILQTRVSPLLLIALYIVIYMIPVVCLRLWQYLRLRGDRGRVIGRSDESELVKNTHRNVGYVNRLGDMMRVNVLVLRLERRNGSRFFIRMTGNYLHAIGQSYYVEGDELERFGGARYPYNPNPERRLSRSLCLHCGHPGSPEEEHCAQCGCTMLRFMPAVAFEPKIEEYQP